MVIVKYSDPSSWGRATSSPPQFEEACPTSTGLLHLLVLVASHLLLDDLFLEGLPHILEAAGFLSCEGLAHDLQSPSLNLRG